MKTNPFKLKKIHNIYASLKIILIYKDIEFKKKRENLTIMQFRMNLKYFKERDIYI